MQTPSGWRHTRDVRLCAEAGRAGSMTGASPARQARRNVVKAKVGDKIIVKGHHLGEPDRDAVVLEVHGADGDPPYVVRWSEDGHEGLYFPGNDATVVTYDNSEHP